MDYRVHNHYIQLVYWISEKMREILAYSLTCNPLFDVILPSMSFTYHSMPSPQLAEITTGRKLAEKLKFQRMNFFQVQSLGIDLNKLIVFKEN